MNKKSFAEWANALGHKDGSQDEVEEELPGLIDLGGGASLDDILLSTGEVKQRGVEYPVSLTSSGRDLSLEDALLSVPLQYLSDTPKSGASTGVYASGNESFGDLESPSRSRRNAGMSRVRTASIASSVASSVALLQQYELEDFLASVTGEAGDEVASSNMLLIRVWTCWRRYVYKRRKRKRRSASDASVRLETDSIKASVKEWREKAEYAVASRRIGSALDCLRGITKRYRMKVLSRSMYRLRLNMKWDVGKSPHSNLFQGILCLASLLQRQERRAKSLAFQRLGVHKNQSTLPARSMCILLQLKRVRLLSWGFRKLSYDTLSSGSVETANQALLRTREILSQVTESVRDSNLHSRKMSLLVVSSKVRMTRMNLLAHGFMCLKTHAIVTRRELLGAGFRTWEKNILWERQREVTDKIEDTCTNFTIAHMEETSRGYLILKIISKKHLRIVGNAFRIWRRLLEIPQSSIVLMVKYFVLWKRIAMIRVDYKKGVLRTVVRRCAIHRKKNLLQLFFGIWVNRTTDQSLCIRKLVEHLQRHSRVALAFKRLVLFGERGNTLKTLVQSWKRRMLNESIRTWKNYTLVTSHIRIANSRLIFMVWNRILHRRSVRVAFTMFRKNMHERHLMNRIVTRWIQNKVLLSFSKWREMVSTQNSGRVLRRVIVRWNHKKLVQAFSTWKSKSTESLRLRPLVKRWKDKKLCQAFRTWRRLCETGRTSYVGLNVLRRMIKRWENQKVSRSFRAWHMRSSILKNASKIIRRMENLRLAKSFGMWRDFAKSTGVHQGSLLSALAIRNECRDSILRKLLGRWARKSISASFHTWKYFTLSQRISVHIMRSTLNRWEKASLRNAFKHWVFVHKKKSLVAKACLRISGRRVARSFYIWKRVHKQFDILSGSLLKMKNRSISSAFVQWHNWTVKARRIDLTIARWKGNVLLDYFVLWYDNMKWTQKMRKRLRRTLMSWGKRRQISAFARWKDYALKLGNMTRSFRRVLARWQRGLVADAFHVLAKYAKIRSRQIYILWQWVKIVLRMNRDSLVDAFERWTLFSNSSRTRESALVNVVTSQCFQMKRTCFKRIVEFGDNRVFLKRSFLLKWKKARLFACFIEWKQFVMLLAVATRWCSHKKRNIWTKWSCFVKEKQRIVGLARKVFRGWMQRELLRAFFVWKLFCSHVIEKEHRILKSLVVRWGYRGVSNAFRKWRVLTLTGTKLLREFGRLRQRRLRISFRKWVSVVKQGSAGVVLAKRVVMRWRKRILCDAIRVWVGHTLKQHRKERVVLLLKRKVYRAHTRYSFSTWCEFTRNLDERKALLTRIICKLKRRSLACGFRSWLLGNKCSNAVIRLGKVIRLWQGRQVRMFFTRWSNITLRLSCDRVVARGLLVRWGRLRMFTAFEAWKQRFKILRSVERCLWVWVKCQSLRCFRQIHLFGKWRHKMKRVIARSTQKLLLGSFMKWTRYSRGIGNRLQQLGSVIKRRHTKSLFGAFTRFSRNILLKQYRVAASGAVIRAAYRQIKFLLRKYFDRWLVINTLPVQNFAMVDNLRRESVLFLNRVLNRVVFRKVSRAFGQWTRYSVVVKTSHLEKLRRGFYIFIAGVSISRAETSHLARTAILQRRVVTMREKLIAWKRFYYQRRVLRRIVVGFRAKLAHFAFSRWKDFAHMFYIHKVFLKRFFVITPRYIKKCAFLQWKRRGEICKRLDCVLGRVKSRKLRDSFNLLIRHRTEEISCLKISMSNWKKFLTLERVRRDALASRESLILFKMFATWKQRCLGVKRAMMRIGVLFKRLQLVSAIKTWQLETKYGKKVVIIMRWVVRKWKGDAIQHWRAAVRGKTMVTRSLETLFKVRNSIEKNKLGARYRWAFQRLSNHGYRMNRARLALLRWGNGKRKSQLKQAFLTWSSFCCNQEKLVKVFSRLPKRYLFVAFGCLKLNSTILSSKSKVLMRVVEKMNLKNGFARKCSAFRLWRGTFSNRSFRYHLVRTLSRCMRKNILKDSFLQWRKCFVMYRSLLKLSSVSTLLRQRRAFSVWKGSWQRSEGDLMTSRVIELFCQSSLRGIRTVLTSQLSILLCGKKVSVRMGLSPPPRKSCPILNRNLKAVGYVTIKHSTGEDRKTVDKYLQVVGPIFSHHWMLKVSGCTNRMVRCFRLAIRRMLFQSFIIWRKLVLGRTRMLSVFQRLLNQTLVSSFSQWKRFVSILHRSELGVSRSVVWLRQRFEKRSVLQTAFRKLSRNRREQMFLDITALSNRRARKGELFWRWHSRARLLRFMTLQRVRLSMINWCCIVSQMRSKEAVRKGILCRVLGRTSWSMFHRGFQAFCVNLYRSRLMEHVSTCTDQNRLRKQYFINWELARVASKHERNAALLQVTNGAYVDTKARLEFLQGSSRAFYGWKYHTTKTRTARKLALQAWFSRWSRIMFTMQRGRLGSMLQDCLTSEIRIRKRTSFAQWKSKHQLLTRGRMMLRRWSLNKQQRLTLYAFKNWFEFSRQASEKFRVLMLLGARNDRINLQDGFKRWVCAWRRTTKALWHFRGLLKWYSSGKYRVQRAFSRWIGHVCGLQAGILRCSDKIQVVRGACILGNTRVMKYRKQMALKKWITLKIVGTRQLFSAWKVFVTKKRVLRTVATANFHLLTLVRTRRVFTHWVRAVSSERRVVSCSKLNGFRSLLRLKSSVFVIWRWYTRWQIACRRLARNSHRRRCFQLWKYTARLYKMRRESCRTLLLRKAQVVDTMRFRSFFRWKVYAERVQLFMFKCVSETLSQQIVTTIRDKENLSTQLQHDVDKSGRLVDKLKYRANKRIKQLLEEIETKNERIQALETSNQDLETTLEEQTRANRCCELQLVRSQEELKKTRLLQSENSTQLEEYCAGIEEKCFESAHLLESARRKIEKRNERISFLQAEIDRLGHLVHITKLERESFCSALVESMSK
mmetsp:Transcript_23146/g.36844  ORF Transcript_23146/g.36844 Transcript_23146/m.36844 type:complete len:2904 (+) Transcript_23146:396-9107(+)